MPIRALIENISEKILNLSHLGLMILGVFGDKLNIMLRIGLTGGIGAGKSTVSTLLASLGATIVDSDVIAREVVEPGTPGLASLVEAFGDSIVQEDESLDRPALAAAAFGNDESRKKLNSIVHPLVGARTAELVAAAAPDAVVIQDIPLLVEGNMGAFFHLVAVVYVDAEERVRRLVELRKMPEQDARARIAAQASDEQRRAAADIWLDNTSSVETVQEQVRSLWVNRLLPFERNIRDATVVRIRPELVAAQPSWADQARRLIARLQLLSGGVAIRIDHIGSTAVPGLDAKDVIDLQITTASLADADAIADQLSLGGFPRIPHITTDDPQPSYGIGGESDPALWGKRIHGGADPDRPVFVHVRVDGWPNQQFALAFRDWLRANPTEVADYLTVKRAAAEMASAAADLDSAMDAYLAAKSPWFDAAYRRTWEWVEATGWSVTTP